MGEAGTSPQDIVRQAVDRFRAGDGAVLLAETPDGSAASLLAGLPEGTPRPVRAAAGEATKGRSGCLIDELGIESLDGRVVVVEQAHWADPSSLGRLQREMKAASSPFLLILSVVAGSDDWGLRRLADTARAHSVLYETQAESPPHPPPADGASRDLVLASSLVSESIPVSVVARFLATSEAEALEVAESLVEAGHLHQTRRGFHCAVPTTSLQLGEARLGHVAGRLAEALVDTRGDPAEVGALLLLAEDHRRAFPYLQEASRASSRMGASGEAHHLAAAALEAAEQADVGSPLERGELHLTAGRYLREAGRSEEAAAHLETAASLLEGADRIDALGFAAAVADDRQRPQQAERILAVAGWEAVRHGETAKLGSLLSFHGRALHRVGFADEADAVMAKATVILGEDSGPRQRSNAVTNRAWLAFDRGQVRLAETHFTHARDLADPRELAVLADREAWRARAIFAAGRPDDALAAVARAGELAARADVEAPMFLADLAQAEGNLAFGRHHEALAAIDRVQDLVDRQLPAWQNVARAGRALILVRMGRAEDSAPEVEAALAATPPGADGWRWRCRIEAIGLEAAARAGKDWDPGRAEDLADLFLQARFYAWAAELMCLLAERRRASEVAEEAMALALECGMPLLAARAAEAGKLWKTPGAGACIRAVRAMEPHVPEDWREEWQAQPGVDAALTAPEPHDDDALAENMAVLERAFRRVGLGPDGVVLSPAQRRSRGLVRLRSSRRSPLRLTAAVVAVVAAAALTSLGVAQLDEPDPAVTVVREVAAPTVAETTTVAEEAPIPLPDGIEFLFGVAPHRGGPARTGVFETSGTRQVDGYYWRYETPGPVTATPVAYGRNLLVPSTDGTLYALDQSTGEVSWTLETEGRLTASPEVAMVRGSEDQRPALAVVGGDDGVVRARDAVSELQAEAWSVVLGTRITSTPVVADGAAFVATTDGFVHALDMAVGEELWRFPADGEGLGPISAPLAYHDGVVYVGGEEGTLYLLEAATGEERCRFFASADIVASPIVADGATYLSTRGNTIFLRPAGECRGAVADRLPLYGTEVPVEVAPAIHGDTMYIPSGQFLYAIDLRDNSHAWSPGTVDAGDVISAAPVVADGVVYFGTRSGLVRAVDSEDGATLWEWELGSVVRASPVVVDDAVFVADGEGAVHALGRR